MDLSQLELTEEQRAAILAQHEEATAGLKAKRDELLAEKKAEAEKAAEAERKAQEEAIKAARKAGELGELEKNLSAKFAAQLAEKDAELAKRDKLLLGAQVDGAVSTLAAEFTGAEIGKRLLSGMVEAGYTDTGAVALTFKGLDGGTVATDINGFKEYLRATTEFSPFLKAVDSSGSGAAGSKGGAAGGSHEPSSRDERVAAINKKFGL